MGLTVLDAGVLIGGVDAEDPHAASAADALRAADERGDSLVLPASAYAEVLLRPSRSGAAAVSRVDHALELMAIDVVVIDGPTARVAASLRAHHRSLQLPDALVIATAIQLTADHLLTTDARWRSLRQLGFQGSLMVLR
jgi:predicted nucleic acid-binding protein